MAFVMDQKVLFKHCDPAGIVFYPRYFEMINDCVEAFFDRIGHPFEELLRNGGLPTVRIDTHFTAPSRHGDHLKIALRIERLGRTSLRLAFAATSGTETRFTASSTLVHINKQGRPAAFPGDLRAALEEAMKGQD